MQREVKTKEELKKAKNDGVDVILVTGKLAEDLIKARKLTTLGKVTLGILTAGIAAGMVAAPLTGGISVGISVAAAAPLAAATGIGVPTIIFASSIGVGFLLALYKDYDLKIDFRRPSIEMHRRK